MSQYHTNVLPDHGVLSLTENAMRGDWLFTCVLSNDRAPNPSIIIPESVYPDVVIAQL